MSPDVPLPPLSVSDNLGAPTPLELATLLASLGLHHLPVDDPAVIGQLSDGERVRVVLARALALRADALIIDDIVGLLDADARELCRRAISTYAAAATIVESGHGQWLTSPDLVIEVNA